MVDEDGNARIMDFGIARSLSAKSTTGAGIMVGTPIPARASCGLEAAQIRITLP
jgi:hypothetical protein